MLYLNFKEKVYHIRIRETLSQITSKYSLTNGRHVVKGIITKYLIFRRFEELPFQPDSDFLKGIKHSK